MQKAHILCLKARVLPGPTCAPNWPRAWSNFDTGLQLPSYERTATEHAQDLAAQRATVQNLQAAVAQSDQRLAQLRSS